MRLHLLSLAAVSMLLFSCSSGDQFDLKYRPAANSKYAFSNVTTIHMDQKMMGQQMKMDQEMIYDGIYEIGAMTADSTYDVSLTYTRMRTNQKMTSPEVAEIAFDSDKPDSNSVDPKDKMYQMMLNHPMQMKVSKDGKVLEFKGMAELMKSLMDSTMGGGKMAEELAGQFSDDNMKSTMEYMFSLYPSKKVSASDSWEIEQKYEAGYPMLIKSKFVLEGLKDGRFVVNNSGTIQTNKGGKGMMAMMAKMIELKGDQTGTIELDAKTGLPLANTTKMKITGEMNMMGAKFPISMESSTKVTLTPVK